jgi:hypothetical protein
VAGSISYGARKAARLIAADAPRCVLDLRRGSAADRWAGSLAARGDHRRGLLPPHAKVAQEGDSSSGQADGLHLPFSGRQFRQLSRWPSGLLTGKEALGNGSRAAPWRIAAGDGLFATGIWALAKDLSLLSAQKFFLGFASRDHREQRRRQEYLGSSIETFPSGREMQKLVEGNGFFEFRAKPLCAGVASIYTARSNPYK